MWSGEPGGPPSKDAPPAFKIDLDGYKEAINWLKRHILNVHGKVVKQVVHDAYPNVWRIYDDEGEIVVNVDAELMERLKSVLGEIEWLEAVVSGWIEDKDEEEDGA